MGRRILIVEDDPAMCVALTDGFTFEGYDVTVAKDGASGLARAMSTEWNLIVLDVMLPRMSGLDVCKRLRGSRNQTPIIMLTARGQEIDKVVGLKIGADDYVTKPFSFAELMARVEALLRRTGRADDPVREYQFGDVVLDFNTRQATRSGNVLELSSREFQILRLLIESRGQVVSRERLLAEVWQYDNAPLTRTVDMHIAKLRRKIEASPESPVHIVTVHRTGYKFCD